MSFEVFSNKEGYRNLIENVTFIKDQINNMATDITDTLVEKGTAKATELNNNAPQSGVEKSKVIKKITKSGLKGYIALTGPNAIYDEFGTGEEGADDGHPLKGSFGLNPYNSGPYVSTHINKKTGRHYWFYYPMRGKPYYDMYYMSSKDLSLDDYKEGYVDKKTGYTEGIPSGKQMYNTSIYLRNIKDEVVKNKVEEYLQKSKSQLE